MKAEHEVARSRALGSKLVHAACEILKENGGEMLGKEVIAAIPKKVKLDSWALERYEKTGYIRWQSILHFHTIACIKAGFLVKKKGYWYLTPEGEKALSLAPLEYYKAAEVGYDSWAGSRPLAPEEAAPMADMGTEEVIEIEKSVDQIEQLAKDQIEKFLNHLNPYEFQDLTAALLRGMGYYTPFVAPAGKDGGIDVIAYRDPLGTSSPRIKVQVKHKEKAASGPEIRQLMGQLQGDGNVGIFVSSAGFTPDAKTAARLSPVHVELIDMNRFVDLWREFYPKLSDEDKARMPLIPIYLLAPPQ